MFSDKISKKQYNKYYLYFVIVNFCRENYPISEFCDDFIVIYREIDKSEFSSEEKKDIDNVDTVIQLYSPFEVDHNSYGGYTRETDVIEAIEEFYNAYLISPKGINQ